MKRLVQKQLMVAGQIVQTLGRATEGLILCADGTLVGHYKNKKVNTRVRSLRQTKRRWDLEIISANGKPIPWAHVNAVLEPMNGDGHRVTKSFVARKNGLEGVVQFRSIHRTNYLLYFAVNHV